MNFLEELVAEWYEYQGFFIRRNRAINLLQGGGYEGEIDIIAYNPNNQEVIHIETSSDSWEWGARIEKFKNKFRWNIEEYRQEFGLPSSVKQIKKIAVVSSSVNPRGNAKQRFERDTKATLITIPQLFIMILNSLRDTLQTGLTIPENLFMLRAIQLAMRHGGIK